VVATGHFTLADQETRPAYLMARKGETRELRLQYGHKRTISAPSDHLLNYLLASCSTVRPKSDMAVLSC
jgi:hypothetical protein